MKTLFLDRDGVILEQRPRKRNNKPSDAHFMPFVFEAMKKLRRQYDRIIVITNQAGIAYGYTTLSEQNEINQWVQDACGNRDGYVDHIYMCPHLPDDGCRCRKPGTLFFEQAVRDFGVDLSRSAMLGDMQSDLEAGAAAGVQPILTLGGFGLRFLCELIENKEKYDKIWKMNPLVVRDLYAFADDDLVMPLSFYAETTEAPCQQVKHSNEKIIQDSLQSYITRLRKAVPVSSTARL